MKAAPKAWFSNDWIVTLDDQREILLDLSAWRERGTFTIDGVTYTLRKGSAFSGRFTLLEQQEELAVAHKTSAFSSRLEVEVAGDLFVLRKASIFSRRFELRQADTLIGSIEPDGVFVRRSTLNLPKEWRLPARLFVFWLATVAWAREQAAAT